MKPLLTLALLIALLLPTGLGARDAETEIKAVLNTQIEAWNRGDIPTFVTTYEEDCIFVGKQITHGKAQLLARYQKTYPTPAAMGHLTFNGIAVHRIDREVAIVTADWRLDRSSEGGGPIGGVFSLVFHRRNGLWKIALDHTT
jgi:uncharacterized protein (TIGR02246 family)